MPRLLHSFLFFLYSVVLIRGDFHPDVRWTCGQDYVSIFVRTEDPFNGIIIPRNSESDDDCSTHGDGANVAALRLPLQNGHCGVLFDPSEDYFHLSVDVRSHPVLIVENDRNFNITCRPRPQQKHSGAGYFLEVFDGNLTTNHVNYAAPYRLRVSGTLKQQNFTVGTCTATAANGNSSVKLTDHRGCSLLPNLLSNFKREDSTAISALLPSMFRFPSSNIVLFSCKVTACDGPCEVIDCEKLASAAGQLLEKTTTTMDVEDDDTVTTVTITVVEKVAPEVVKANVVTAKEEPAIAPTAEPQCARPADMDLLYGMCIVLTVCSAFFLTINVCFCCIMWRRRKRKPQPKSLIQQQSSNNNTDFWIMEQKPAPQPENLGEDRRVSSISYASVKQKPRRTQIPVIEYGLPASRASDTSSGYGGDVYRRPEHNVRLSNSTFITPSVTMETDLDSSISSNQTSSYH